MQGSEWKKGGGGLGGGWRRGGCRGLKAAGKGEDDGYSGSAAVATGSEALGEAHGRATEGRRRRERAAEQPVHRRWSEPVGVTWHSPDCRDSEIGGSRGGVGGGRERGEREEGGKEEGSGHLQCLEPPSLMIRPPHTGGTAQ